MASDIINANCLCAQSGSTRGNRKESQTSSQRNSPVEWSHSSCLIYPLLFLPGRSRKTVYSHIGICIQNINQVKKKNLSHPKSPKTIHSRNGNLLITIWAISLNDYFTHTDLFEEAKFKGNSSLSCPLIILRWFPMPGHWPSRATFFFLSDNN